MISIDENWGNKGDGKRVVVHVHLNVDFGVNPNNFFKLDGKTVQSCTHEEWSKWSSQEAGRVGFDQVGDVTISTVFTGIGRLFETLVQGNLGLSDELKFVHPTWEQAELCHQHMVEWVKAIQAVTGST